MSIRGTVKNGVVVLPPEAKLPEGAHVEVTPLETRADDPPFLQAILKLAKPRPDWPEDFALNHAHYTKGLANVRTKSGLLPTASPSPSCGTMD